MSSFIAFCENPKCGTVFEVLNLVGGAGTAAIVMTGTKAGPCPNCDSSGRVPDGVYQYANNAVSFLTGPETSVHALKQVHELLRKAKLSTREEVLEGIKAISPQTASVLESTPKQFDYKQWLVILIAIVALAIQVHTSYLQDDSDLEELFIKHILQENKVLRQEQNKHPSTYKRGSVKIPRNALCPCGSGKKYKKCCLFTSV